jgi:hypothetical protein
MEIKAAIPNKWVYKPFFCVYLPGSLLTGSVVRELVLQRVCRSLGKAASLAKINVMSLLPTVVDQNSNSNSM